MKLIFTFCLLLANVCYGQAKKDNAIMVHGVPTYKNICAVLFNNGFSPTTTDTSLINTNYKDYAGYDVRLNILRSDTSTIIRGFWKTDVEFLGVKGGEFPIDFVGEKAGIGKRGIALMTKIAEEINIPFTYFKIK